MHRCAPDAVVCAAVVYTTQVPSANTLPHISASHSLLTHTVSRIKDAPSTPCMLCCPLYSCNMTPQSTHTTAHVLKASPPPPPLHMPLLPHSTIHYPTPPTPDNSRSLNHLPDCLSVASLCDSFVTMKTSVVETSYSRSLLLCERSVSTKFLRIPSHELYGIFASRPTAVPQCFRPYSAHSTSSVILFYLSIIERLMRCMCQW